MVYWRLQPTAAEPSSRFREMHRALRTRQMSLNDACMRTVCKWFRKSNDLLALQIRTPCRYFGLGGDARGFLNASSEAKTDSEKKRPEVTRTLRAGSSKAEPKSFAPLQTPFPGARDGQNLISWRWSLPLLTNPVWWDRCTQFPVIVVIDPQTNKHTNPQTHKHIDRGD